MPKTTPYVSPAGKIPSRPEDVQRQARGRAHDQAEQQLSADVARDGVLDQPGVVVLGRPVAGRHHAAHELADARAVEQHVDRQHEDQDQVEQGAGDFAQHPAAEGHDRAGALGHLVAERLQRGFALLDEVHVEAVVC